MEPITVSELLRTILFANLITAMFTYGMWRLVRSEYDTLGFISTLFPLAVVVVIFWPT